MHAEPATSIDARHRLLDAAERLVRDVGYERMSIRAVNKAAGMNPAAVHYHFGSKEALVTAVLERRLRPVWEGRLADLEELTAGGDPPHVNDLVAAVVEPMARLAADPGDRWLLALLTRLVLSGHPLPWRSPWSTPAPWITMIGRALPRLPADIVAARWHLARDLVFITYGAPFAEPGDGPVPPPAQTVTAFVAAGLTAPYPNGAGRS
jgi:AcrR family transcriptional regulator